MSFGLAGCLVSLIRTGVLSGNDELAICGNVYCCYYFRIIFFFVYLITGFIHSVLVFKN